MSRDTSQAKQKKKQASMKWKPSILIYLLGMNFILLCLLFPTLAIYLFRHETSFQNYHLERMLVQMRQSIEQRSASLAHSLALSAGQAIAGFNFSFLNNMVGDVVGENEEILYCYVIGANHKVLAHNDPEQVGQLKNNKTSSLTGDIENKEFGGGLTHRARPTAVRFKEGRMKKENEFINVLEVITPVFSGANLAGFLRLGYSLTELDREIAAVKQEWTNKINKLKSTFIVITLLFFLVGGAVSFIFTRTFVRSTNILSNGVKKIASGDLKHRIRMDSIVCTEFIQLSESFNTMTDKLRLSYEQLEQYSKNLEQKVEERTKDLKLAQANLLRQAHEAGMAEMAVGILHNIGNAITPAKVSTDLLIKKIRESRIRNHIREMMDRFEKIIKDPDGSSPEEKERIQQIISVLPAALMEEYQHFGSEIKRIRNKHEHIESIIHLQLRYARLSGNVEDVNINKVVSDALEMLEESIKKYSVTVTNELQPDLPSIRIEQSNLLQVLINLVKNAMEASRDMPPEKRLISITTKLDSKRKSIAIIIKDSGIGFEPEVRKNLFAYGYTTKKAGSGFGLHSCANFLIAHRGSIEAKSEGTGKGAEFIVTLPVSQEDDSSDTLQT